MQNGIIFNSPVPANFSELSTPYTFELRGFGGKKQNMRNLEDNNCCVYCGEKTNIRKLVTLDTINGKEIINVSLCPNHLNKTHKEIRNILGVIN